MKSISPQRQTPNSIRVHSGGHRARTTRRGVAVVESAVVLLTLAVLLVGVLDFGLATYRYNMLGEAARRIARAAIVRGAAAEPDVDAWGPATQSVSAADDAPIVDALGTLLAGFSAADVTIEVSWPDGDNQADDRVHVELRYPHTAITPLVGFETIDLQAVSTMYIVQ